MKWKSFDELTNFTRVAWGGERGKFHKKPKIFRLGRGSSDEVTNFIRAAWGGEMGKF